MHVLAVDLGTTGIKVAVVGEEGAVRAVAGEVIPLIFVGDRGVEQDPNAWWAALGRCSRRAVGDSGVAGDDIGLIAVTSQYTSTTPVGEGGLPVGNTIMWMDGRGRTYHRPTFTDEQVQRWIDVHGMMPSGNDDLGHVHAIRHESPDAYSKAVALVEPMDALVARLTGVVSATQNTMFPMLSVDNRTWGSTEYCDELLALSGMPADKLPPLVPMGVPRGSITSEAATHLGVSSRAIVSGATVDSVTSAIGTGAIEQSNCGLVIGTTTVMATHVPSKRHDSDHGLTSAPSPLPHQWFLVAENGIGGKAFDVFVNQMVFADDGLGRSVDANSYDDVLAAAATVPCGSNGVLFLPWLVGSMAPKYNGRVRGGFANIGLASTRADMARAVLEGVAMNVAWLLPHFSALAGTTYEQITFGGGGAASALWGQLVADATGVQVRRLARPNCTNAHGAALLALYESGALTLSDLPQALETAELHDPDETSHRILAARTRSLIDFHAHSTDFYSSFDTR